MCYVGEASEYYNGCNPPHDLKVVSIEIVKAPIAERSQALVLYSLAFRAFNKRHFFGTAVLPTPNVTVIATGYLVASNFARLWLNYSQSMVLGLKGFVWVSLCFPGQW